MSRVQQLYQLQSLDSEIDQAQERLAEIEASLGQHEALDRAEASADAADKQVRQAQARLQDLDLEVKGLVEKIDRQEKVLYGGGAKNPKEAANLQEEVASLKRRRESREELLLEALVETEETEAELERLKSELATVQEQWAEVTERLEEEKSSLQTKVDKLADQRPTITSSIAKDDLEHYGALRQKKAGRAVALLKDGVCQGCGMAASNNQVRQARTGAELTYCSVCGRILYIL